MRVTEISFFSFSVPGSIIFLWGLGLAMSLDGLTLGSSRKTKIRKPCGYKKGFNVASGLLFVFCCQSFNLIKTNSYYLFFIASAFCLGDSREFVEAGRRTSHVVPSSVLERVRSFVSKVAVTNECLSASSSDEGFHIEVVETDDDSTAGSDLSHEEDEEALFNDLTYSWIFKLYRCNNESFKFK